MRSIQDHIADNSAPSKSVAMVGIMNVWNLKDFMLIHNPDYWINKNADESFSRDGTPSLSENKSVPTCDIEKITEIHEIIKKNQYRYNLMVDD